MLRRALLVIGVLAICSQARAEPCPADLPLLFVVQDRSGSMSGTPDGKAVTATNPTKWTASTDAVTELVTDFDGRLRYGLQVFPGDNVGYSCTAGVTVLTVPATPAQVTAAYQSEVPRGATPVAKSLEAAAAYLATLNLANDPTAPSEKLGYVLLMTDGLPNCNQYSSALLGDANCPGTTGTTCEPDSASAPDPATCASSSPPCVHPETCDWVYNTGSAYPSATHPFAEDCLDDADSRTAAAALKAAGIKVYVVGFGTSTSLGNNKAILDGIAAAGGTTSASTALDQSSLNSVLDTIAFDSAKCCVDACPSASTRCTSGGLLQTCSLNGCVGAPACGCTRWVDSSCPAQTLCQGGNCVACANACPVEDAAQCAAGTSPGDTGVVQKCTLMSNGCLQWVVTAHCQSGTLCSGGACVSCAGACTSGDKTCNGLQPRICQADGSGCTSWADNGAPCAAGGYCSGGVCNGCGTQCTLDAWQCSGATPQHCEPDAHGCTVWVAKAACAADQFCSNGVCTACPTQCDLGATQCAQDDVQTCVTQANGCLEWSTTSTCPTGQPCQDGACLPPCSDECSAGALQCATGVPQTCEVGPRGCRVWQDAAACATGNLCVEGVCRQPCIGGEIDTCPDGFVCTATPNGLACLPGTHPAGPDASVIVDEPDSGEPLPVGGPDASAHHDKVDAGTGIAPSSNCGCASVPAAAPMLALVLAGMALLRRRR